MCGIVGVLNHNAAPVSQAVLKQMTDAIAHRGPDGEGQLTDGAVGLGHRRLAIIDLSPAGQQPMCTADSRYAITYNGEIYNFRELRRELEEKGHRFRSTTDSEVLLYAYAEWGEKCVERLNGMFAFAVWDRRERTLFLARDRYGTKPLYYTVAQSSFLFGSEVKALLAHPSYRIDLDREALFEYFTFQNYFTARTLFKEVRLLPAGTYLRVAVGDARPPVPQRYWDFDFREPREAASEAEYLEELDRLFHQAVKRQLVSDVEIGSYLSGGMDSGSITALAAREMPRMKSFTIGFDLHSASGLELAFDERQAAEHMSYLFKTEHYEMVLKAGDMEHAMARVTHHLEEPRVGQSYPNFYAAQLASKFVKVAFAGTGGDEIFGGYPWRYYRAVVNDGFEAYIDKYYQFWQRLIPNGGIRKVFKPIEKETLHISTRDLFRDVFPRAPERMARPEDFVNHSLYFESKTFLHGLLVVEDKLSMSHGLETRVPFLDNDLVDFAMRVPVHMKLGNLAEVVRINENEPGKLRRYFQRTRDGKLLLRKMLGRYVPVHIIEREKQGFTAPDASWFRGDSIDYVKRVLYDDDARIFAYLDRNEVRALVDEHIQARENRRLLVWSFLSVEAWLRRFIV